MDNFEFHKLHMMTSDLSTNSENIWPFPKKLRFPNYNKRPISNIDKIKVLMYYELLGGNRGGYWLCLMISYFMHVMLPKI